MFKGSLVPLITPFTPKRKVDWKALADLVEWQIAEGTDGIICSATTGEGVALSEGERKKIAALCLQVAAGRIPILASTGVADTRTTVRYTEQILKLGCAGCLVVTPYYNKPSAEGCYQHYKEVSRVGLPIIMYHNPTRTGVRLNAEAIAKIGTLPQIVGLKDSAHDLNLVRQIRQLSSIPIFPDGDDLTCQVIREGGAGAISVIGNLIPRGYKRMIELALVDSPLANVLSDRYASLLKALFLEVNPQPIKYALSWFKRCHPTLRLPLIPVSQHTEQEMKKTILELALPFKFQQLESLQKSMHAS